MGKSGETRLLLKLSFQLLNPASSSFATRPTPRPHHPTPSPSPHTLTPLYSSGLKTQLSVGKPDPGSRLYSECGNTSKLTLANCRKPFYFRVLF
ncbi:hypothetical protein GWI33_020029 [Rhynchophorus ferrugineus]|uniref:Uncharacterized protein n=1 Tax=Rhynchophorus ferrugineus TaxID=354439 RepID=A0A834I468_RHYFE|nr:hypothetical protein GWI33_020029 [Rhynchophorus ferrugineus]